MSIETSPLPDPDAPHRLMFRETRGTVYYTVEGTFKSTVALSMLLAKLPIYWQLINAQSGAVWDEPAAMLDELCLDPVAIGQAIAGAPTEKEQAVIQEQRTVDYLLRRLNAQRYVQYARYGGRNNKGTYIVVLLRQGFDAFQKLLPEEIVGIYLEVRCL
jgi:hypothetical protein